VTQLENLVSDRHALKAHIRKMESVANFMKLYEDLIQGNVDVAGIYLSFYLSINPYDERYIDLNGFSIV
jgi:hypothetical protein